MQLAAYAQPLDETLGIHIDCAQIIVSTPEIDQSFILTSEELDRHRTKWLQKIRRYQEIKEEEEKAKHILKELKQELEDSRDDLTSSDVSTEKADKTNHCPATVS